MNTRPSGSVTETDDEPFHSPTLSSHSNGHKSKQSRRDRDIIRTPGEERTAKDRRRRNEPVAKASINNKSVPWRKSEMDSAGKEKVTMDALSNDLGSESIAEKQNRGRARWRNPWSFSALTVIATFTALLLLSVVVWSFSTRQLDPKGCAMSYMRPSFIKYTGFDTEHTPFANKYSLYLYREGVIDEDPKLKGVPVLFIPGNAGSYKQVRPLAAEAAYHYHNSLRLDIDALRDGKRPLDFFSVDFNEDITAFHGQTLLDQAEYLNDAISYILSQYHDPARSNRERGLPDPTSVIIVGHSMGGVVARTMLTIPNYQPHSVNTIITLAAPHARPAVSFDGEIVRIYKHINDYWRNSYSHKWANDNPLWHVTLISIAGGGLDTIVPSDYASLASLVPDTHGFTVFTSSIPTVWTGMDHLAITWCDQLRKSVVRALYDVIDVNRPTQTRKRAERMTAFKKRFLTGLEDVAERQLPHEDLRTLLAIEDDSTVFKAPGERLIIRSLGLSGGPKAHLIPTPPHGTSDARRFTLLTDQKLDTPGGQGTLEVLFCNVHPVHSGHTEITFQASMDLSANSSKTTRLACKTGASDVIQLPASTHDAVFPFDQKDPFSFLQYDMDKLAEFQFVAVVDKAPNPSHGWLVAEFSSAAQSVVRSDMSLEELVVSGLDLKLADDKPLLTDVKIPALQSSLLAYKLRLNRGSCTGKKALFAPLLRQYVTDVHESKFFVNVQDANINVHGVAPYMPPNLLKQGASEGLSLQIWSDPSCEDATELSLQVDIIGSMGKLWMRYRLVFAAFPLLVVALVLRKQFKIYDDTGIFMSFSEALNQCLKTSLPVLILALTFFSTSLARSSQFSVSNGSSWLVRILSSSPSSPLVDYSENDLLLGFQDSFFWFLVPLFGLISTGICVGLNFLVLTITHIFAWIYGQVAQRTSKSTAERPTLTGFAVTSTRRRVVTTGILLLLVLTVIPYHFAYVLLCLVQIATCTRAYRLAATSSPRPASDAAFRDFYNYTHSILLFMLWILPINIPVLVVWIRNLVLANQYLSPFSSHHNILSVLPIVLLVETLTTGRMIPRVRTRWRLGTNVFLFGLAVYAAVYGVAYGYVLHHLANVLCAWLVLVHFSGGTVAARKVARGAEGGKANGTAVKRRL